MPTDSDYAQVSRSAEAALEALETLDVTIAAAPLMCDGGDVHGVVIVCKSHEVAEQMLEFLGAFGGEGQVH